MLAAAAASARPRPHPPLPHLHRFRPRPSLQREISDSPIVPKDDDDDDDQSKEASRGGADLGSSGSSGGGGRRRRSGGNSVLFLSPTLWPRPSSSAAGVRTAALLRYFGRKRIGNGGAVCPFGGGAHYGSGARWPDPYKSDAEADAAADLDRLRDECGVTFHSDTDPNRSGSMRSLLSDNPALGDVGCAVFDRFFAEEAYSYRVREHLPGAALVLDMQDMHSLRAARRGAVERWDDSNNMGTGGSGYESKPMMTPGLMEEIVRLVPGPRSGDLKADDVFLREVASVHRSDLTLVCSPHELGILRDRCGVDPSKLALAPFFASESRDMVGRDFESRSDFAVLGGFRHPPNVDSVLWIKGEVWPRIRSVLPAASLRVYGAHPPRRILDLHDEDEGFLVEGYARSLDEALGRARVLLAPLRYGAGVKGKIVDAWRYGVPAVTTPVGAEGTVPTDDVYNHVVASQGGGGRLDNGGWGGLISPGDADSAAECAVRLHEDRDLWSSARSDGLGLLRTLFDRDRNLAAVAAAMGRAVRGLEERRDADVTGAALWHQSNRSTEFFSRWIELKETRGGDG